MCAITHTYYLDWLVPTEVIAGKRELNFHPHACEHMFVHDSNFCQALLGKAFLCLEFPECFTKD